MHHFLGTSIHSQPKPTSHPRRIFHNSDPSKWLPPCHLQSSTATRSGSILLSIDGQSTSLPGISPLLASETHAGDATSRPIPPHLHRHEPKPIHMISVPWRTRVLHRHCRDREKAARLAFGKFYEAVPAHIVELMQKALNAMMACETRELLKPTAGAGLSYILV